jgi:hypothetical protein
MTTLTERAMIGAKCLQKKSLLARGALGPFP